MDEFATIDDLVRLYRPLSDAEKERAEALISAISAELRYLASKRGRDLDEECSLNGFGEVVKTVVCDATMRSINKNTSAEAATQMSQGANGYTFSITPFNAGGGVFITRAEYAKLGLRGQRYGAVNFYE